MKKIFLIMLLVLGFSVVLSSVEIKQNRFDKTNISFVKYFKTSINKDSVTKFASNDSAENFLSDYKNLFLPLTIAFGVFFIVDFIAAIVLSATYAASSINGWWGSQPGLLAGTIATWSMFSFFGILTVISLVLFIMANPNSVPKTNKKAMLDIRPTTTNVSFDIIYKF